MAETLVNMIFHRAMARDVDQRTRSLMLDAMCEIERLHDLCDQLAEVLRIQREAVRD